MFIDRDSLVKRELIFVLTIGQIFFAIGLMFAQVSQERTDFTYGERLYKEGLFDLAVIQFKNFVEYYPNSPKASEAQFLLAECTFSLGRHREAQKEYLRLIIHYPISSLIDRAQFRIGECYEKMGKGGEAVESYYRVYSFHPESQLVEESLYRSGRLSMEMGDLVKAESTLRLLIEHVKTGEYRSKASFLLSQVYIRKEEYERAIKSLESPLLHPIRETDRGEATFLMGRIYEMLGRWKDSEEEYRKLETLSVNQNLKQKTLFRLGHIFKMEGKNPEAVDAFQQVLSLGEDEDLRTRALFSVGVIKTRLGDFQGGFEAFEASENKSARSEDRLSAQFEKTRCLEALSKIPQAINEYEAILRDPSPIDSIWKKTLLSLASLFVQLEDFQQAIECYSRYLTSFPKDRMACIVLLQLGKIYIRHLDLLDEGLEILRRIRNDFPMSASVPESRFVYAEGLEEAGRLEEAIRIYRMIITQYPGSQLTEKARERLEEIDTFYPVDFKKGFSKLSALIQAVIQEQVNSNILFELGTVFFRDLKQYEDAIDYLQRYLSTQPESQKRSTTLFQMAQCYEALYIKERTPILLDSTKKIYAQIILDFSQDQWADEAGLKLVQWEESYDTPKRTQEKYRELLEKYPNSNKRDEMLFRMGLVTLKNDSLDRALSVFNRLITDFPESLFLEETFYHVGKIQFEMGNYEEADSILAFYNERFSDGRFQPQALFYRARMASWEKDYETSERLLESLKRRFLFSPWADSSRVYLGEIYLQSGNYSEAVELYRTALEGDSIQTWSSSVGLIDKYVSLKKVFLAGLARAYEGLKKYKKAKLYYFQYGRVYRDPEDRVSVFSSLSRIAEAEGIPSRSVDYLSRVNQEIPSDSTAEELGQLYFRLGKYEDAVRAFDQASTLSQSKLKQAFLFSRIIVSLIRQDKIPQAEVRMNVFNQSFRKDTQFKKYQAEFALEKGIAHIREKEFESALESFREVIQKYRETTFMPYAELEIGRVYLITNKVEDALDILTTMPNRYTDHPVLPKVYLNLGDHYFRSQQYDNAMRAFKLAMDDSTAVDVVPVAMRYLIRVYDSLRMWDAALGMVREYIRRFPRAEDVLEKRVQIGTFYSNLKEYSRAIEYLRDVKKDADDEAEAEIQYWIADCFYNMGQFEQAIFEFLKVEYLSKPTKLAWNTTALYKAGQAYLKLNKPGQARLLFEKIVQKEGATSEFGRIARERIQEIDAEESEKE